jgi:hypothetical protein
LWSGKVWVSGEGGREGGRGRCGQGDVVEVR